MITLFERPLFIGAHSDDIELFAGGTLARFAESASVLVFSHHGGGVGVFSPHEEMMAAMKIFGIDTKRFISYGYRACTGEFESGREIIAERMKVIFDFYKPDIVITHQSSDTNQDHQLIYREVLRVFKDKCSILCGCFPSNDLPPAKRSLFIKLTKDQVDKKMAALMCYESQRKIHRTYLLREVLYEQMKFWGSLVNSIYAEPFEVMRLIV